MVHLSLIEFEPRRQGVLTLLSDSHALHREICRALPDRAQGGAGRCLHRAESARGKVRLLVQTASEPDWQRLQAPANVIGVKTVDYRLADGRGKIPEGTAMRFRLRANPTFVKDGRRLAWLKREQQGSWLARKGELHGFKLPVIPSTDGWFDAFEGEAECRYQVRISNASFICGERSEQDGSAARLTHFGVDFDGVLIVTDRDAFAAALESGIGSAKAFGFGLLSLARA